MAPPTLTSLPPETVEEITNYLPRNDLLIARCISKTFAAAATPKLFRIIPLWISIKSLECLTCISHHSLLNKYVEGIVFSPVRLRDLKDDAKHFAQVKKSINLEEDSISSAALKYGKYRAVLQSYTYAQEYLAEDDLQIHILARALRNFPRFTAITIYQDENKSDNSLDYHAQIGVREYISAFGCSQAADLLSSDGQHTLSILIEALAISAKKITSLTIGVPTDFWMAPGSAQDSSAPYLKPALNEPNNWDATIQTRQLSDKGLKQAFQNPSNWGKLRQIFSKLSRLRIEQIGNSADLHQHMTDVIISVQMLISATQALQRLVLSGPTNSLGFTSKIHDLFLYPVPKHIQILCLSRIEAKIKAFIRFVKKLASTIQEIHLDDIYCTDETWKTIMDRLRDISFPNLKTFLLDHCDCIMDDEICERIIPVHDYLLRRTSTNPCDLEEG